MNFKEICPFCEVVNNIELVTKPMDFEIRKEIITLNIKLYHCLNCDEYYEDPNEDMINIAYRKYREIHDMMQPEEIKEIRSKYGLTQQELSKLLGFGKITLSRYENGSLQNKSHDNSLQLIKIPKNLLLLVNKNKNLFSEKKLKKLKNLLENEILLPNSTKDEILGKIILTLRKSDHKKLINESTNEGIDLNSYILLELFSEKKDNLQT